ncbi:putative Ig domain-containing protein, partial [Escherichia fergusonii]|uniref:putative Ig domain-containing protein n=1 Tax=Escherichia fergusonii TaxID=564 RepID=UPI001CBDEA9C
MNHFAIHPSGRCFATFKSFRFCPALLSSSELPQRSVPFTGGVSPVVSISPSLPQGLNLNASTGEITGIPTVETGA